MFDSIQTQSNAKPVVKLVKMNLQQLVEEQPPSILKQFLVISYPSGQLEYSFIRFFSLDTLQTFMVYPGSEWVDKYPKDKTATEMIYG